MKERLSIVAAVLDGFGGAPVVVTRPENLWCHVRPGMIPIVVPDLLVQEPIPWHRVPSLLRTVDLYVDEWIRGLNDPELRDHMAVKLYVLRRSRGYQKQSVNLWDIVET